MPAPKVGYYECRCHKCGAAFHGQYSSSSLCVSCAAKRPTICKTCGRALSVGQTRKRNNFCSKRCGMLHTRRANADPVEITDERELYWCAGFLEGEGSFFVHNSQHGRYPMPTMSAKQATREPLVRLQRALGGSISFFQQSRQNPNHSDTYRWHMAGRGAVIRMRLLYTHLSKRRQQQIEACLVGR